MTAEERNTLLEKEEYQYQWNESFLRSLLNIPGPTQEEVAQHMRICKMYLDARNCYDGKDSPFAIRYWGKDEQV